MCGIYLLASIGLGGNIPIDATIAHEFLPQNRRNLVTLLSLWQPVGVVFASGVAYGTAAKYRCAAAAPACSSVADGVACCTVASNMGWRYLVIVLGAVTLFVFFIRFFIFTFHESPKFLLSQGREAEAIEVLHKIAKFNKAPPPALTLEKFAEVEQTSTMVSGATFTPPNKNAAHVVSNFGRSLGHAFKGIFTNKLQAFIFGILAIAYMVGRLMYLYRLEY